MDDVHAPQLTADFWKGNQVLAKELAYKPPPYDKEQTNPLSISLMTTHGTDHTNQCHSQPCQSPSNEGHPHTPTTHHGGSHSDPDTNRGRNLLQHCPPTPHPPPHLTNRDSVRSLTLDTDTGDNPARVHNGWTVVPDGRLCSPNGKIWHLRHFGDRYAINMVNEDGTLGTTPYVHYAINPQGDPTMYGIFQREGIIHSKPLKALASHQLATSHEGHLNWLNRQFALQALIDVEL